MNPNIAEVTTETRLEERPLRRVEGFSGRAQNILHDIGGGCVVEFGTLRRFRADQDGGLFRIRVALAGLTLASVAALALTWIFEAASWANSEELAVPPAEPVLAHYSVCHSVRL